ncbi:hypothetical protein X777_12700 [Ooceraea biroi]|uniref:Uncharacterized protein n=1 Tax=Ooceraea biroi TaxID=2015173 RepID=A0A026W144_OOCBI|nr:hypothetical protein X777_12700 [Ooceraea biroi]
MTLVIFYKTLSINNTNPLFCLYKKQISSLPGPTAPWVLGQGKIRIFLVLAIYDVTGIAHRERLDAKQLVMFLDLGAYEQRNGEVTRQETILHPVMDDSTASQCCNKRIRLGKLTRD